MLMTANNGKPMPKVRVASAVMYSSYYNLFKLFQARNKLELDGMRTVFIQWLDDYDLPLYGLADAIDKFKAWDATR